MHKKRLKKNAKIRNQREKQIEYDYSIRDWEDALEFFDYKCAYSGNTLIKPTKDHIMPVVAKGGTIRENIIPCEFGINSSKGDFHMLDWYKKQPFFNNERLNKILSWMGDYKKHLYNNEIKARSPKYLGGSTLYFHKVPLPNGDVKQVYYPNNSNPKKRTFMIQREVLDDWEDYCNDNWITFDSGGYGYTPEDKVKKMLDNAATYLLVKHREDLEYNYLEYDDLNEINNNEIRIDSFFDEHEKPESLEESLDVINQFVNENSKGDGKIIQPEPVVDKIADRRKKRTKLDKFNDIYGRPSNISYDYIEDNRLPFMPKYWREIEICKDKKHGVIDKSRSYSVEWVEVRKDMRFTFKDNQFRISAKARQYLYQNTITKFDDYRDKYKMTKVLCYEQDNKYHFYDENINNISEFVNVD